MMLAPLPSDVCERLSQPLPQGRLTLPMADIKAKNFLLEVPTGEIGYAAARF